MIVLLCGSRALVGLSASAVAELVRRSYPAVSGLVSGGAMGVDRLAPTVALLLGVPCVELRPDYARYGRRAPLVRDLELVARADAVCAVWDGSSRGTAYTLRAARRAGKPIRAYRPQ